MVMSSISPLFIYYISSLEYINETLLPNRFTYHSFSQMALHNLIDQTLVFPATRRNTSLPLTFLDLPLAGPIYVRRQFFYHFPYSTSHFCETTLPVLKHSLSLALQHFYPLSGNLICPPPPHKPVIRCTDHDSVTLTTVESSSDFNHLSSNQPKNLKDLDHLVPKLTYNAHDDDDDDDDETFIFPLVSLQATIFPNHGLCIAITYCHVMDDCCCSHFMKSWSFIHQTCVDFTHQESGLTLLPYFDREVLKDPRELESVFLRDYYEERKTWKEKLIGQSQTTKPAESVEDYVKATIVFGKEEIDGLKNLGLNEWKKIDEINAPESLSRFVVTCAFVWATMVKTRNRNNDDEENELIEEYFRFAGDCRDRLGYPIPEGYFGNCLTLCHATLKRKDLKGREGFVNAVRVIQRAVNELKRELFRDAEEWRESIIKMFKLGSVLLVTGSNRFTVYQTDFGFGRPLKVEMVHSYKGMSLAESGDKEGLEVGLVFRSGEEFEYFNSLLHEELGALNSQQKCYHCYLTGSCVVL